MKGSEGPGILDFSPKRLRARAQQCMALAAASVDRDRTEWMLKLAREFESLAVAQERRLAELHMRDHAELKRQV